MKETKKKEKSKRKRQRQRITKKKRQHKQTDGVNLVYFRFTLLLGRPRYLGGGDLYLYLCSERSEVRVTACVILFAVYMCCTWDDEKKGEGETRCRLIACSSRKAPRGPKITNVTR